MPFTYLFSPVKKRNNKYVLNNIQRVLNNVAQKFTGSYHPTKRLMSPTRIIRTCGHAHFIKKSPLKILLEVVATHLCSVSKATETRASRYG